MYTKNEDFQHMYIHNAYMLYRILLFFFANLRNRDLI